MEDNAGFKTVRMRVLQNPYYVMSKPACGPKR